MKRLILIGVILFGFTKIVFAYGDWVTLNRSDSKSIDYKYAKYYYEDFSENHRVSIVIKGSEYMCPYSIQYNPVSGNWKK